ncbi:MAG: nucleotidyltransferase domain-containing protein [Bacteroides sp.]|nr:nucleotidyltransferase domain-containing protein [Ruminococcus flavefaciens]MCM1554307.1 nucleotidyltransferase domain-containing protein [Bacteroides sp.]
MNLIKDNLPKIFDLCRKHKVSKLYAFGSVLTPKFNNRSDVDMLVDFKSEINHNNYADNYLDFHDALRALFGREIDLVDDSAVTNPIFREELDETKQLIYG